MDWIFGCKWIRVLPWTMNLMIFGLILIGASRSTVEAIIILSKVALNTVLDPSIDTPANSNWITTTTICKRFSTAHHVRKWCTPNPSSIFTAYQSVYYSPKLSAKPFLHAKYVSGLRKSLVASSFFLMFLKLEIWSFHRLVLRSFQFLYQYLYHLHNDFMYHV